MNRGPALNARQKGPTFAEKAAAAWGNPLPDWIAELARLADRAGLGGCAEKTGYSKAAVSTVLANKYAGDMSRVEEMVRGSLMQLTVDCPVIGDIGRDRCLSEQKEPFRATSNFRVMLYHTCRGGCPHSRLSKENADGASS